MQVKKVRSFFFPIWVFFHKHSWFTGQQGKGEAISLNPLYYVHPLHRHHIDISRANAAESLPLHVASSWTRTENLWFPSASCLPLTYAPVRSYKLEAFSRLLKVLGTLGFWFLKTISKLSHLNFNENRLLNY